MNGTGGTRGVADAQRGAVLGVPLSSSAPLLSPRGPLPGPYTMRVVNTPALSFHAPPCSLIKTRGISTLPALTTCGHRHLTPHTSPPESPPSTRHPSSPPSSRQQSGSSAVDNLPPLSPFRPNTVRNVNPRPESARSKGRMTRGTLHTSPHPQQPDLCSSTRRGIGSHWTGPHSHVR